MKVNKRYNHVPAQPGWEAITIDRYPNWPEIEDFQVERCPVVAWEIECEFVEIEGRSYFNSFANPVVVGATSFDKHPTLKAPDGSVYVPTKGVRFKSELEYAIWDWCKLASKSGMEERAREVIDNWIGSIPALAELKEQMLEAAE